MIIAIRYQHQPSPYQPIIKRSGIMTVNEHADIWQKAREYVNSISHLDGGIWGGAVITSVEPIQNGYV